MVTCSDGMALPVTFPDVQVKAAHHHLWQGVGKVKGTPQDYRASVLEILRDAIARR
jgi:hypothetical protein